MLVKIGVWPILIISFIFILLFILKIDIFIVVLIACFIYFLCKQRQDYCRSGQNESKHVTVGFNFYLNPRKTQVDTAGNPSKNYYSSQNDYRRQGLSTYTDFNSRGVTVYSSKETSIFPFNMWGKRSFTGSGRTPTKASNGLGRSFNSPINGRDVLNSSMPMNVSMPVLRQRRSDGVSANNSMLSPAGPLLSSPFMPQIKRALGLEPKTHLSYSQRRSGSGLNTSVVVSPASPGTMPHVRLTKPSRQSLSDRNSSMLNRSSTVKIAPPIQGKVASPSLTQLRNESITVEERGTPDTYAVVSALKERRKRSINTHEELQDQPVPQAKRRRQESQQSNASTSSMPSLPDNLPDLSNTDFTMRLETPGIKRPSRPSQEEQEEWQKEAVLKRRRSDYRNNSILSSLSSSSRFINAQMSKRKASTSFSEKENDRSPLSKTQRQDPPKLTHINLTPTPETPCTPRTEVSSNGNKESSQPETNGHTEDEKEEFKKPENLASGPIPLKRLPSMKKTSSIYSGLSGKGSFKNVQYANVVATIDDYDADREAENDRAKQMLQDIDAAFTEKEAQKVASTTSTATTVTTSVAVSSALLSVTTTTSSTTTPVSATTTSVLSALEKLSKSPPVIGQAGKDITKPGSGIDLSTVLSTPTAIVTPVVTQKSAMGSPVTSPVEDSINLDKKGEPPSYFSAIAAASVGTSQASLAPALNQSASSGVSLTGSTILSSLSAQAGTQPSTTPASGFKFGTNVSSTVGLGTPAALGGFSFGASAATTTVTTPASSTAAPLPSAGFTFGASAAPAPTPAATTTVAAPAIGFSFGAATSTPASTAAVTGPASGFTFGAAPATLASTSVTTTAASVGGFSFGMSTSASTAPAPSTAAPAMGGGFSFGSLAPTPTTATLSTPGIGATSTATSTPAFSGFGSAGGFPGFGSGSASTSLAANTPATTLSTAPLPTGGFSFGGAATQATSTAAGGFSFGAASSTTASKPGGFSFGSAPAPTASSATPSLFGTPAPTAATTAASAATFSFGGASSTAPAFGAAATTTSTAAPAFSFGASQPPTAAAPSPFGAPAATTVATGFAFGGAPAPASTAQSGFTFGDTAPKPATTTATAPAFSFGGGGAPAAASPFGSTPTQASAAPTFNFGQANTQPSATPGLFAFGNSAGGSTSQTPAFGSANPTPAFGTANQPPAFGSTSTNPAPAFGAPSQTPAFGAASTTQSSVFGASTQQTPAFGLGTSNTSSAFGNATGASPSFGKSHSMPTFGNVDSSAGGFNFGAQAAPNVNPFGSGQTTPAKQTGSAFGQISNDTTPKQQTGALFQFGGGNQSNTNSSAQQGFNFAAAAANTNQNTGGFNFTSTPGTAGFGTPGATPGSGAFSVNSLEAARPPRIMSRARRRGLKK